MRDQWRNKEGNKSDHSISPKNNIQTKMIYQYPKKAPFRFPVIPDEMEKKETLDRSDAPAYQRRRVRRQREQNTIDKPESKPETKPKKVTKNSSKKFVPSEVPSPIYGYQKQAKVIENVPTFIRNQQEKEQETEPQENKQESVDATGFEVQAVSVEQEKQRLPETKEEVIRKEEPVLAAIEQPIEPKREQTKRIHNRRKDKRKNDNKQPVKQVQPPPFNVMMTHNDKKSFATKGKAQTAPNTSHFRQTAVQQSKPFPAHLLNDPEIKSNDNNIWVQDQQDLLEETLKHFNVKAKVVNATQGPSVTRFEVQPELGVKVSRVRNLNDDIKLNMSARDIRIEAPIPGKNTIGIEIPNLKPQMVGLQEIFEAEAFKQSHSPLTIGLGLTVEGQPLVTNISKMPHGLIAGATGSGKSVCINTILISLLYKASHEDVKLLLIDPKMVELAPYNDIPHLVSPVITDVKAATAALKWAVNEMEDRYDKFVQEGVRDIGRYNDKMKKQGRLEDKMPFMVIVIDELADLMMISPQDVEDAICRIAQKARACGMHLLLATQRPSVDVITGLIKANIPTRIAFSVSSQIDSRTIIDTNGAERLLGKGDMLFMENGSGKSVRLQGAFVSDEEIERVTNHARTIASPHYLFEQDQLLKQIETKEDADELLEAVIEFVFEKNQASTSLLQRQFRIGYNRAARLIDSLEDKGIITGQNGSKPREVLLSKTQLEEMY